MKYVKHLPFKSELDGVQTETALWKSEENACEMYDPQQVTQIDGVGECDNSGLYYGTGSELEPKFCARHFYQIVVNGDGKINYKLTN